MTLRAYRYQDGFSDKHSDSMYNKNIREQKAKKIISILSDYYRSKLKNLCVLDIGSSTGFISYYISNYFREVVGIDIDKPAVKFAKKQRKRDNARFVIGDSMNLSFYSSSFDIVICAHIYEHVPDSSRLMEEIYRVLKNRGICFFAAGNRLNFMEPHYKLPLLSVIPMPVAHLYLRLMKRGNFYYEKHLTYWELKRLASRFEVIDYTLKIIKNPEQFNADEMLNPGTLKAKLAFSFVRFCYILSPTYIWILLKR
jgi:2-polyprenyl-3-methyl-5-hydroxy-6-metoxy-1,4-benzoquinol methylase